MSNYSFNPLQLALKPLYEQAKSEDELFAKQVQEKESRTEKPKSFGECCEYIMGEAYKYAKDHKQGNFGLAGMDDQGLIGLIKHYYDEDDIKIEKIVDAKPVVKATKTDTKATKETKPKKEERPKETLTAGLTKMIRPKDEKEAKRESKKQAKAVEVMDMFAGMWDDEEETDTAEVAEVEEDVDDLPM